MANNLTIRITVPGTNWMVYPVAANGQVMVKNDAGAKATVRFVDESPLCQAGAAQASIDLDAGAHKSFAVCSGTSDQTYGFVSIVENGPTVNASIAVEPLGGLWANPIFIIQMILPGLAITLFASVAISYLVMKFVMKRQMKGPPNGR